MCASANNFGKNVTEVSAFPGTITTLPRHLYCIAFLALSLTRWTEIRTCCSYSFLPFLRSSCPEPLEIPIHWRHILPLFLSPLHVLQNSPYFHVPHMKHLGILHPSPSPLLLFPAPKEMSFVTSKDFANQRLPTDEPDLLLRQMWIGPSLMLFRKTSHAFRQSVWEVRCKLIFINCFRSVSSLTAAQRLFVFLTLSSSSYAGFDRLRRPRCVLSPLSSRCTASDHTAWRTSVVLTLPPRDGLHPVLLYGTH